MKILNEITDGIKEIISPRPEKMLWSEEHYIHYANHYKDLTEYVLEKYVNENPDKLLFMTLKEYNSELYQEHKNSSIQKICNLIGGGPTPTKGGKIGT